MAQRIALTLHTLGGLTTAEIAAAFLVPNATMGQRLFRAKRKIKQAEVLGLLGLMLLHHSRRRARVGAKSELISLAEQNRALWDVKQIQEGTVLNPSKNLSLKSGWCGETAREIESICFKK